ncbi:hypothetical protein TNCV_1656441 [Trichonephila clavipes]|nr:hypothetical protein TNCV_1656441 [Trichonephila clavipes]
MGGRRSPKLQRQFVHLPCLQETDLKGMWGCLRSTDSMVGEAVSLHSLLPNRNCKIYRQNFEADDFPSGAVNLFKGFFTESNIREAITLSPSTLLSLAVWKALRIAQTILTSPLYGIWTFGIIFFKALQFLSWPFNASTTQRIDVTKRVSLASSVDICVAAVAKWSRYRIMAGLL